ncbi:MAG: type II toxin-antitoxin system VapC family toxin [Magnetococcales bacterium]|nr:type II toxin-antitoxin system VapC family toxin [Magnetococcales bacterium]
MKYLFDSNLLIYHLNNLLPPCGRQWIVAGLREGAAYSVMTRIEILGYPLPLDQLQTARRLLGGLIEIGLTESILERTIAFRQCHRRLKIPDALIAATAREYALPLVTRNLSDFDKIAELSVIDPFRAWP